MIVFVPGVDDHQDRMELFSETLAVAKDRERNVSNTAHYKASFNLKTE